ncbi:cell wall-binding repeat-containing protein [Bacillus sp. Marseille-Q3570]|uniref:cell wall-binding repeat-containing protein n=1 Tax=Bacillus sp. Marseille-Q3570 TaxID=2963522 RepID=UPI0021B70BB3|nr:cell wall-binding repeat-containing protein [Bacillus sp. Marseille-Q3570]
MKTPSYLKLLMIVMTVIALAACNNATDNQSDMEHEEKMKENEQHDEHGSDEKNGEDTSDKGLKVTAPSDFNDNAEKNLLVSNSKNVTRLNTTDPVEMAVMTSQTIWPSTHKENRPGAIILAPLEDWAISSASADLIHHPNDGPLLFIEKDSIPEITRNEIDRLNPKGNMTGAEIMVMGDVDDSVIDSLKGYEVKHIKGDAPAEFAKEIDKTYAEMNEKYPESVIVGSLEDDDQLYTTPAVNWIAHMPEPLLYVSEDGVPEATKQALEKRKGKANIYLLGPESIISKDTEEVLSEYGKVTRISGETPIENSIAFARFKDKNTNFGWGLTDPGHGISFISSSTPDLALAGAPFAHLGKHAPMVWLEDGQLNQTHYEFFSDIKPTFKDNPTNGPYNHAFLLGNKEAVSFKVQGIIDDKLEIVKEGGGEHGGH